MQQRDRHKVNCLPILTFCVVEQGLFNIRSVLNKRCISRTKRCACDTCDAPQQEEIRLQRTVNPPMGELKATFSQTKLEPLR